jgi:CheY-like chemotaxis protein
MMPNLDGHGLLEYYVKTGNCEHSFIFLTAKAENRDLRQEKEWN